MMALSSADSAIGARGTIHMSPAIAVQLDDQFIDIDGKLYTKIGLHKVADLTRYAIRNQMVSV